MDSSSAQTNPKNEPKFEETKPENNWRLRIAVLEAKISAILSPFFAILGVIVVYHGLTFISEMNLEEQVKSHFYEMAGLEKSEVKSLFIYHEHGNQYKGVAEVHTKYTKKSYKTFTCWCNSSYRISGGFLGGYYIQFD